MARTVEDAAYLRLTCDWLNPAMAHPERPPPAQLYESKGRRSGNRYGAMLWFSRKTLSGSQVRLSARSRSALAGP